MNLTSLTPERSEADQIAALTRELAVAYLQIQDLKEQLRLQRIKKYGPGSEKLSDAQLDLLEGELGVSNFEVQAESAREPLPVSTNRKRRRHPGRQKLPAELPHVEQVIVCTPEQCICKACGQAKDVIGYDVSELLDAEPAKYFVMVTRREKRPRAYQIGVVFVTRHVPTAALELTPTPIEKARLEFGLRGDVLAGHFDCAPAPGKDSCSTKQQRRGCRFGNLGGWSSWYARAPRNERRNEQGAAISIRSAARTGRSLLPTWSTHTVVMRPT